MKNHKLKLLNVAVLACFGLAAQQASAVVGVDISSGGTNTPIKIANEKTSALTINATTSNNISVDAYNGLNTTVAPLTVRFDLIGGLKFGTSPVLHCATANSALAVKGNKGTIIVGGNNNNYVTFKIGTGTLNATAATCALSAGYATTGSLANKTVSASLSYAIGGVTTSHSRSGGFLTFSKSLTAKFTPAAGSVKVDATKSAQKFVTASSATLLTASLGLIQFSTGAVLSANGGHITPAAAITTATITVSGPSLAAGFTAVSGQVYLVSAAHNCIGGTVANTYASKSGNTVTFKSLSLAQLNSGYKVCLSVNGKNAINTGAVTATLAATAATNFAVDTTATSNALTTVGTNGSTMNAYFINASTSPAKTSVIRIINTAGYASTSLTATAYGADGTVLGTSGASLGTVKANGMLTLTSANIESDLGITGLAPTDKYRLVISSDMTSFKVVNFIQDVGTGAIHLAQQQDN